MMFSQPWWITFIRWHVATDHPWDQQLSFEAMEMAISGLGRELSDALMPVIERAARALSSLAGALG